MNKSPVLLQVLPWVCLVHALNRFNGKLKLSWFILNITLINFSLILVSLCRLCLSRFFFLSSCAQLSTSVNALVNFCSGPYQLYYIHLPHQAQVRASLNILIRLICKWIFPAKITIFKYQCSLGSWKFRTCERCCVVFFFLTI